MEFMDFTYTKPNSPAKARTLLVLGKPSQNYFGIDMSDMLTDEYHAFSTEFNQLQREFEQKKADLMARYDLKYNYRQFSPDRMQDVTVYHGWDE